MLLPHTRLGDSLFNVAMSGLVSDLQSMIRTDRPASANRIAYFKSILIKRFERCFAHANRERP